MWKRNGNRAGSWRSGFLGMLCEWERASSQGWLVAGSHRHPLGELSVQAQTTWNISWDAGAVPIVITSPRFVRFSPSGQYSHRYIDYITSNVCMWTECVCVRVLAVVVCMSQPLLFNINIIALICFGGPRKLHTAAIRGYETQRRHNYKWRANIKQTTYLMDM